MGVASAQASHSTILLTGVAGLVAGAISMAAGEYVSVCSQADTEKSDLDLERHALEHHYEAEVKELALIYQQRGVESELSTEVARQLMQHDPLAAHARDEIGISEITQAQPLQAALSSAASFTLGALLPLLVILFSVADISTDNLMLSVAGFTLLGLAGLGSLSAKFAGASQVKTIFRVVFWGSLAMAVTAFVGELFSVSQLH